MEISFINQKVFYRFVEFTSRLIGYDLMHEDYKLIALNQKEANTNKEKKVKRLADAWLYLINQTKQILDFEIIKTAFYLLTKKNINNQITDKLLEQYYMFKDEAPHDQAAHMMLTVNNFRITSKLEFSLLLCNYCLIRKEYFPVIYHETDKSYVQHMLNNKQVRELTESIYLHEYQTRHGIGNDDNKGCSITLDTLVSIIKKNEVYLKTKFRIQNVFAYGSLVKNTIHKSSDIDLLVILNDNLVSFQKYECINEIQKYLKSILKVKLDVLDFSYSLKYAEIKEISNAKKIF